LSHALIYRAIKGSRETLEEARREPVEEVVENGLTGHIVASIEEATATLRASWRWIAGRCAAALNKDTAIDVQVRKFVAAGEEKLPLPQFAYDLIRR
jgi:hypothetical protein